jgi:hypothetical protein
VSPALVLFIVLGVGYTVLFEGVAPGNQRRLEDLQQLTTNAKGFEEAMRAARAAGNLGAALESADLYLAIDPGSAAVRDARQGIEAEAARKDLAAGKAKAAPSEGPSATALIDKARAALEARDWMAAHDFATQAHALEPDRTDAMRIAALAWDELSREGAPGASDKETAALFAQKKEAYLRLQADDPFTAYYSFVKLAAEHPRDRDIAVYLEKARQTVARQTFFLDEVERARTLPGTRDILFVNRRTAEATEAFSFGSLVESREGTYFLGIEAIRYRPGGAVDYHLAAPYGKLAGQTILLHGVHRTDSSVQSVPVYYAGQRSGAERFTLTLQPAVEDLRALTVDQDRSRIGLPQLWLLRGTLSQYGVPRQQISAAVVMKAVMPFLFLTLSFLAVSLGWALRARYLGRAPARVVILVPLIPAAVSLACLLWVHAHRVLLGFVVLTFGFTPALVVLAALEAVVLAISVILLAGQSAA